MTGMLQRGLTSSSMTIPQCPQALCVSPTRELASQIYNEARKFSHKTVLRPVVAYGGVSVSHQLRHIESGCNLLVATPGRLLDFVEKRKVSLLSQTILVVINMAKGQITFHPLTMTLGIKFLLIIMMRIMSQ